MSEKADALWSAGVPAGSLRHRRKSTRRTRARFPKDIAAENTHRASKTAPARLFFGRHSRGKMPRQTAAVRQSGCGITAPRKCKTSAKLRSLQHAMRTRSGYLAEAAAVLFASARRSVFLRRTARFLTLSLPLQCPIDPHQTRPACGCQAVSPGFQKSVHSKAQRRKGSGVHGFLCALASLRDPLLSHTGGSWDTKRTKEIELPLTFGKVRACLSNHHPFRVRTRRVAPGKSAPLASAGRSIRDGRRTSRSGGERQRSEARQDARTAGRVRDFFREGAHRVRARRRGWRALAARICRARQGSPLPPDHRGDARGAVRSPLPLP